MCVGVFLKQRYWCIWLIHKYELCMSLSLCNIHTELRSLPVSQDTMPNSYLTCQGFLSPTSHRWRRRADKTTQWVCWICELCNLLRGVGVGGGVTTRMMPFTHKSRGECGTLLALGGPGHHFVLTIFIDRVVKQFRRGGYSNTTRTSYHPRVVRARSALTISTWALAPRSSPWLARRGLSASGGLRESYPSPLGAYITGERRPSKPLRPDSCVVWTDMIIMPLKITHRCCGGSFISCLLGFFVREGETRFNTKLTHSLTQ